MALPIGNTSNQYLHQLLLVEDDSTSRRLFKYLFTNAGYSILEAEDGVAALELLSHHPCELVITDLHMPRMDGMKFTESLRRSYPHTYIIMITAFSTPDTEKQAFRIGVDDYLAKPFDFEKLEQRVRSFFADRPASN
jgi:two-component system chemotaxis response regulator CheY